MRLHNDGPGVALDVAWSVRVMHPPEEHGGPADYDHWEEELKAASQPLRGLRAGESSSWWEGTGNWGIDEWVVIRFTDSAGVRWEYDEPSDPDELAKPARRLGKVRRYRPRLRRNNLRHYLDWHLSRLRRRPMRPVPPDW